MSRRPRWLPLLGLIAWAAAPSRGQDEAPQPAAKREIRWRDPTLQEAVRACPVIVLAEALAVGPTGVRYEVLASFRGGLEPGSKLLVSGLHHPELAKQPPVEEGQQSYLLLSDAAPGQFAPPTPSFGRFDVVNLGNEQVELERVVAPTLDTYDRLALEPEQFERLLQSLVAANTGQAGVEADKDVNRAVKALRGRDSNAWSVGLAVLQARGRGTDAVHVLDLLDREEPSPRIRRAAVAALGKIATPTALGRLLTLAERDPDRRVRAAALRAAPDAARQLVGSSALPQVAQAVAELAARELNPKRIDAGSLSSIQVGGRGDPRRFEEAPPLVGAFDLLVASRSPRGLEVALKALEPHRKSNGVPVDSVPVVTAALAYLEFVAQSRPGLPGELIERMRGAQDRDAVLNALFANSLQRLTGQELGRDKEAWQRWWSARSED